MCYFLQKRGSSRTEEPVSFPAATKQRNRKIEEDTISSVELQSLETSDANEEM
jgi:hypothetical protein